MNEDKNTKDSSLHYLLAILATAPSFRRLVLENEKTLGTRFLQFNMASGVRLGGRLCFRVCMSAHHHTRYRTLTSNLPSYLWRYRLSSGINTVGTIQKTENFISDFFLLQVIHCTHADPNS